MASIKELLSGLLSYIFQNGFTLQQDQWCGNQGENHP